MHCSCGACMAGSAAIAAVAAAAAAVAAARLRPYFFARILPVLMTQAIQRWVFVHLLCTNACPSHSPSSNLTHPPPIPLFLSHKHTLTHSCRLSRYKHDGEAMVAEGGEDIRFNVQWHHEDKVCVCDRIWPFAVVAQPLDVTHRLTKLGM